VTGQALLRLESLSQKMLGTLCAEMHGSAFRIAPGGRDQAVPMHLGLTCRSFVPLVTVISALIHL
jgi:hypothetical protein